MDQERTHTTKRLRWILGVAVAAGLLAGLVATSQGSDSTQPNEVGDAPVSPAEVAGLSEDFSVLDAPIAETGLVDASEEERFPFQLDSDQTRVANVDGESVEIVPGDDALCVAAANTWSCADAESAVAGQLYALEICGAGLPVGKSRVTGLQPDGIDSVVVVYEGGQVSVPVVDNAYSAEVAGAVQEIQGPTGQVLASLDGAPSPAACAP